MRARSGRWRPRGKRWLSSARTRQQVSRQRLYQAAGCARAPSRGVRRTDRRWGWIGIDRELPVDGVCWSRRRGRALQSDISSLPHLRSEDGARAVTAPLKDGDYDLAALLGVITDRTKIAYLANPNNPTGAMIGRGDLARFLARLPAHVLPVIDEAYHEYVEEPDYADPIREHVVDGPPGDGLANVLENLRAGRLARRVRDRAS
jgi:hypothetical protein